jgi:hypothetical protein
MLVQDSRTGYFHEVPDRHVAGYVGHGQVVFDGLGNPVGFSLNPLNWVGKAVNVVKGVASNIPIVGGMVNNLIPGSSALPPTPYPYPQAQPYPAPQVPPNFPSEDMDNSMSPEGYPYPTTQSTPWQNGWNRPYGAWRGWRRRLNWRGRGGYGRWSRGWGRSYGHGNSLWRAGRGGLYSNIPIHYRR